ncbi:MAG: 1-acyl-sn-glycerol-3-phosphate acyltransferase [Ruminococcaceae bacterium]|nr:1-acyl-sn-glycerol-3-phosphate acyltransferase [Oscillospiraceae bacterium]
MLYQLGRALVRFAYFFIFRVKVTGRENIPAQGGIIFCSNHRSNHDAPLVYIAQKRKLTFMAKDSLFAIKPFGWLLKKLGAFPIKRGAGDIGAVKKAIEIVQAKNALVMFPEGTRNRTQEPVLEFKNGAALIAKKGNALMVPVAITGSYRWFAKKTVSFGTPLDLKDYGEKPDMKQAISDLQNAVATMLTQEGTAKKN